MVLLNSTNTASVWLAGWTEQKTTLRAIRSEVFIHEQQVPEQLEWDSEDSSASHFIICDETQTPVGVARLLLQTTNILTTGHIGRMAITKQRRQSGFGSLLLASIIRYARDTQLQELQLNAQCHALSFYARQGFRAEGQTFEEAGIMHQSMLLLLKESHSLAELKDDEAGK